MPARAVCRGSLDHQEFESLRQDGHRLREHYGDRVRVCDAQDVPRLMRTASDKDVFVNTGPVQCDVHGHRTLHYTRGTSLPEAAGPFETCVVYCENEACASKTRFLIDEVSWVRRNCRGVALVPEGWDAFVRSEVPVSSACRRATGPDRLVSP